MDDTTRPLWQRVRLPIFAAACIALGLAAASWWLGWSGPNRWAGAAAALLWLGGLPLWLTAYFRPKPAATRPPIPPPMQVPTPQRPAAASTPPSPAAGTRSPAAAQTAAAAPATA